MLSVYSLAFILAVGTIDDLSSRYASYEVHFTCRSRGDVLQARRLMSQVPGSRKSDDVATRFEVPIDGELSLAQLFNLLSSQGDFLEYTVERASLESIFLKVVKGEERKDGEIFHLHRNVSASDAERAAGFMSIHPQRSLVRLPNPNETSRALSQRNSVDYKRGRPSQSQRNSLDFGSARISLEVVIPKESKGGEQKPAGWYRHPTPQTARVATELVPLRPQGARPARKYQRITEVET